jgi:hypothetical protein
VPGGSGKGLGKPTVAVSFAWILIKALFFMTVILGPIVLIGFAVDNRYKNRPDYVYTKAVIKLVVTIILIIAFVCLLFWLGWHHKMGWGDWGRAGFVSLAMPSLWQDWKKLRLLTAERREAKLVAESEDNRPSEFHYASEMPK